MLLECLPGLGPCHPPSCPPAWAAVISHPRAISTRPSLARATGSGNRNPRFGTALRTTGREPGQGGIRASSPLTTPLRRTPDTHHRGMGVLRRVPLASIHDSADENSRVGCALEPSPRLACHCRRVANRDGRVGQARDAGALEGGSIGRSSERCGGSCGVSVVMYYARVQSPSLPYRCRALRVRR